MSTLPDPQFALPPLSAFKFAPFIFLQVVLLHPAFSNAVSRPLRFLLIFPALWYSARAPFHRIEPAHLAIGANWRLGVFGPELCLKALEWGLAVDRKPYQWIGFDGLGKESDEWKEEDSTKKKEGAEESLIPRNPDGTPKLLEDDIGEHGRPAVVTAAHSVRAGQRDGPWRIFLSSLHLLTAMRGIGYAFGPPAHSLAPPPPREPRLFLKYTLSTLLQAHVLNTACVLLMINRDTTLPHFLHTYLLPFLPLKLLTNISHIIAYMFVPISLHFQIVIGLSAISLLFFAFNNLFRTILPTSLQPARFDAREWPPLFNRAFAPRSVTHFWGGGQWHHLFRKPFTFVGYDPVVAVLSPLAGKPLSRMVGALAVFVLSGWLHDQGMWSARHGLPSPELIPLSFTERWGAWIFFVAQAFAVVLEGAITRVSGKKFSGPFATVWAWAWIMGVGVLAGRSWIAMGLVRDLPPVRNWGWQRFVFPTAVLAPPPLWTK